MPELLSTHPLLVGMLGAVVFAALFIAMVCALGARNRPDPPPITLLLASPPEGARLIPPDGSEVFFEEPSREHNATPVYLVTVSGMLTFRHRDYTGARLVDPIYDANRDGRFDKCNYRLLVNNKPLYKWDPEWIEQDRCLHHYTFTVGSLNTRIGIAFDPPSGGRWPGVTIEGALYAAVRSLPAGTLTRRQREEAERRERRAAREAAAREGEEARCTAIVKREAAERDRRFWAQVNALRIEAQLLQNWADPQFTKDWGKVHTDELLAQADDIRAKARAILSQTAVVQELQKKDPAALAANLGQLAALTAAELHSVQRKSSPPAAPKVKRKLTAEEVRNLKVRRQQLQLGDRLALAKDRAATIEDTKAYVKAQYPHLDEDEQQQIVQQLIEQIREENQNGKTL